MAPKFALLTKGSKLPLNKGFKNTFELLQSCTQPLICFYKEIDKSKMYRGSNLKFQKFLDCAVTVKVLIIPRACIRIIIFRKEGAGHL